LVYNRLYKTVDEIDQLPIPYLTSM